MNQTTVKIRPAFIHPALSRLVLWLLVLGIAFWTLEQIKTTLTVFGLAFLIAYLLNSVVTWLERRYQFPRGRAILLVYLVLFTTGAVATALLVPMIVGQVNAMVTQLPEFSQRLTALAGILQENYISRVPLQYQAQLEEALRSSESSAAEMAKSMLMGMRNFILHLVSAAFLIFTSLIVSIYVILRWGGIWQSLLEILPLGYRHEIVNLARDLNKIFGGYLKAQITLASTCGLLTFGLLMLHSLLIHSNPYALVISVVAALTLPIPVLNQVIPPITAIILGMINVGHMSYAIQLAVLVYAVNLVVERVLAPRIMSEAVGVSPLFVLLAAFSGAELLGPVGALVGVPLAAMIKSIFVWFHGRFLTVDEEAEQAHMASLESEEIALKARLHTVEARLAAMEERQARRISPRRRRLS
ncbi:MAG: AI-2E family transporter [Candidatus Eremiobacteraeota bacterium]|nr:AI-2E family transporter [Candidatus Eremiobacteraeota bacterium]MCW5869340.1 AI-2E family transporter [Candidatus Eremiobacteraeota bacterium]